MSASLQSYSMRGGIFVCFCVHAGGCVCVCLDEGMFVVQSLKTKKKKYLIIALNSERKKKNNGAKEKSPEFYNNLNDSCL